MIGESIEINGVYFKVVGLFEPKSSGDEADRQAQSIYVPFSTFQHAFNRGEDVDWFARARDLGVSTAVVDEVLLDKRVHDANISMDVEANNANLLKVVRESLQRKKRSRRD